MTTTDTTSPEEKMVDSKGRDVPMHLMKPQDLIIDQAVQEVRGHALDLMGEIARFRGNAVDDVNTLMQVLSEEYGAKSGGPKGNVSFPSFDGLTKIEIRIQNRVDFGPELQIAKALIDEYVEEISEGARDEVRELLTFAFDTDNTGNVNRERLYSLRRRNVDHPLWARAMDAIADSMRVVGSKAYFQISVRDSVKDGFKALPINLANAFDPEAKP